MKGPVDRLLEYVRTRLHEQTQWPDPDVIYRRSGLWGLVNLIRQSPDPDMARDVLARYGADVHPDAWPVGPNVTIHEAQGDFSNLSIGAHVHIGREVFLDLSDRLVIEESTAIGMRAVLLTHLNVGHGYRNKPMTRLFPRRNRPTIIRRGCSIGAGAIIACGVEIGEDSLVNAGVVVDRDVPPRTVVHRSRPKADMRIPDRFFEQHEAPQSAEDDD